MTAPITGPFSQTISVNGPPSGLGFKPEHLRIVRKWYRQKKPYNLPLTYNSTTYRIRDYQTFDSTTYRTTSNGVYTDFGFAPQGAEAYNRAYAKFTEAVHGEQAQLAVSWLERQKSIDMMAKRLVQTVKLVRAIRHFQWDEAAKLVGFKRSSRGRLISPPEWRTFANKSGSTYLEFHFGWEPTIKEVMRCIDLLSGDWPRPRIKTRASSASRHREVTGSGFSEQSVEYITTCKRSLQAEIRISDPNLLLADQVGLVNPLTTVNEIIPFSFVADWVVNLSDYLESFYPFTGISLVDPQRGQIDQSVQFHYFTNHPSRERWTAEYVDAARITGPFPGPTLRLRRLKPLSVTRAATAASLLVQLIQRGKAPW